MRRQGMLLNVKVSKELEDASVYFTDFVPVWVLRKDLSNSYRE